MTPNAELSRAAAVDGSLLCFAPPNLFPPVGPRRLQLDVVRPSVAGEPRPYHIDHSFFPLRRGPPCGEPQQSDLLVGDHRGAAAQEPGTKHEELRSRRRLLRTADPGSHHEAAPHPEVCRLPAHARSRRAHRPRQRRVHRPVRDDLPTTKADGCREDRRTWRSAESRGPVWLPDGPRRYEARDPWDAEDTDTTGAR